MKKNSKIISKRIIVKKKSGKILRKKQGQSHYNSKDSGNKRRAKRKTQFIDNKKSNKKLARIIK